MPSRSLVRTFLVLYATLGVVVCLESVLTVVAALHGGFSPHDRPHALLLGGVEAAAAILFLIPRTMPAGATFLLAVFALAFGLHLAGGHPNFGLLIYAAAVLFIRAHGVRGYHWTLSTV
jgi:uncharacterized membrane protein HdeD (DUF308 family)